MWGHDKSVAVCGRSDSRGFTLDLGSTPVQCSEGTVMHNKALNSLVGSLSALFTALTLTAILYSLGALTEDNIDSKAI